MKYISSPPLLSENILLKDKKPTGKTDRQKIAKTEEYFEVFQTFPSAFKTAFSCLKKAANPSP